MHAMPDRVARALLFTDVVDSTRWVEQLGDAAALERWAAHDRAARDLMARHGGQERSTAATASSCSSTTSPAAVHFARDYHAALATLGSRPEPVCTSAT